MSDTDTVTSLLTRNLLDVFSERDPIHRRAAIKRLFHTDAAFIDHKGVATGHEELDRRIGDLHERTPGWVFEVASTPQALGDAGRLAWRYGPRGEQPHVTGMDLILVRDGRIAKLYAFLDKPAP